MRRIGVFPPPDPAQQQDNRNGYSVFDRVFCFFHCIVNVVFGIHQRIFDAFSCVHGIHGSVVGTVE